MDRRELLKMIALVTGTAVIGGEIFLTGCETKEKSSTMEFTDTDVALLDEIAETILPRTSTPGAKDAAVGAFMTVMVKDCYTMQDQEVFFEGMIKLNEISNEKFGKDYVELSGENRVQLLNDLEVEANEFQVGVDAFNYEEKQKEQEEFDKGTVNYKRAHMSPHYYKMLKQLTLLGFFTSEVGATQALRHVAVPGRYEGCIPYQKGDRSWA